MEQEELKVDPQQLRAEAEKEPSHRGLDDYRETIRLLKDEKGFSYREIAGWFQQRGLNVDHNAVWRAYSKTSTGGNAGTASERSEQTEHNPADEGAMPWM